MEHVNGSPAPEPEPIPPPEAAKPSDAIVMFTAAEAETIEDIRAANWAELMKVVEIVLRAKGYKGKRVNLVTAPNGAFTGFMIND